MGAEAFVRWSRQDGSVVGGRELVAGMGEWGLLPQVDAWVLRAVARELSGRDGEDARRWVGVNVARESLADAGFRERLTELLGRGGTAGRVVLELPARPPPRAALPALLRLRSAGCRLALDVGEDLGGLVGRCGGLPVDLLKVPAAALSPPPPAGRGAVGGAGTASPAGGEAAARAAEELGADLAACRVESGRELVAAADAGARLAQGRFLGEPRPARSRRS